MTQEGLSPKHIPHRTKGTYVRSFIKKSPATSSTRRFRYWSGVAGAIMALIFAGGATGCGSVQDTADKVNDTASQVQDGASKAGDIASSLPTSPADVTDKLKSSFQTVNLTLDSASCSLSKPIDIHIATLGANWPTGRYISVVEHSTTKDGNYTAYKRPYTAYNPDPEGQPKNTWSWNCAIPKDDLGWYRLSIVHLDGNGQPDKATKWAKFEVVS